MQLRIWTLLLLVTLLIAATALTLTLDRDATSPDRDQDTPATTPVRVQDTETAAERLRRMHPSPPTEWTPMRAPSSAPTVRQALLKPTAHDGHAGLFTTRPTGFRPVAVVLHATGNGQPGTSFPSLQALGAFFQRQGVAASHYGIDRHGRIMQYVSDEYAAFHVATPGWNGMSIGIELLNDNTGSDPFPAAQLRATRQLVAHLGATYDIPAEAVVKHREIQPTDRSDPAANFPWDSFVASLGHDRSSGSRGRLAQGATRLDVS